jgi:hypothetical protein
MSSVGAQVLAALEQQTMAEREARLAIKFCDGFQAGATWDGIF